MDLRAISVRELARLCAETGRDDVWQELIRRSRDLIARTVLRVCARYGEYRGEVIDELVQETYVRLCANECRVLRHFQGEDTAFFGLLKVIAATVAHDHIRGEFAQKRGRNVQAQIEPEAVEVMAAPPPAMNPSPERHVLLAEIGAALDQTVVGPDAGRLKLIFWLYYRQGLTAHAIAGIPGVELTTKGVESALLRLTRTVREKINVAPAALRKGE